MIEHVADAAGDQVVRLIIVVAALFAIFGGAIGFLMK